MIRTDWRTALLIAPDLHYRCAEEYYGVDGVTVAETISQCVAKLSPNKCVHIALANGTPRAGRSAYIGSETVLRGHLRSCPMPGN